MKNVIVYSSDTCGYCHAVKKYLESNDIKYTEKNVSTDEVARKELMKLGYMGVPIIMINDDVVQGFDKNRIQELLEL